MGLKAGGLEEVHRICLLARFFFYGWMPKAGFSLSCSFAISLFFGSQL